MCGLFSGCSEWGLISSCHTQASRCSDSSCWGPSAPGCVGFSSCGSYLLTACSGIFLAQGSNSCLLHWQAESLPLSHQGSPWFTPLVLGTYSLVVSKGCLEVTFFPSVLKMPLWCRIWNYFQTADSCPMWIWHSMPFRLWKCGIKPVFIYVLSFFNALSGS